MEKTENEIREREVKSILHWYRELAKLWPEDSELFITIAVYSPISGINKPGITQISVNGACYDFPVSLNPAEIDAIRSELIGLGATTLDNSNISKYYGMDRKLDNSFYLFLNETRSLTQPQEKNTIIK